MHSCVELQHLLPMKTAVDLLFNIIAIELPSPHITLLFEKRDGMYGHGNYMAIMLDPRSTV